MKNLRKTRNTLSLLLAFALLAGILPQSGGVRHSATATDEPTPGFNPFIDYGDVNGDGVINAADVTMLRSYIASQEKEDWLEANPSFNALNADVNGDGFINSADVTQLRRYIASTDPLTVKLGPVRQIHTMEITEGLTISDTAHRDGDIWHTVEPQQTSIYEILVYPDNLHAWVNVYDSGLWPVTPENGGFALYEGETYYISTAFEDITSPQDYVCIVTPRITRITEHWNYYGDLFEETSSMWLAVTPAEDGEYNFDFDTDDSSVSADVWALEGGLTRLTPDVEGNIEMQWGRVYFIEVSTDADDFDCFPYVLTVQLYDDGDVEYPDDEDYDFFCDGYDPSEFEYDLYNDDSPSGDCLIPEAVEYKYAVAAGQWHSLALKDDGSVWAWGNNERGQLGDGTTNNNAIPKRITTLENVVDIAAGYFHNLAIKDDGSVWTWGRDVFSHIGGFTTTPEKIDGLENIVAISAGLLHNLALRSDGTVFAWGNNGFGQLGDGTYESSLPKRVEGIENITAIAAGGFHSLALRNDGAVFAWGSNQAGVIGNNSTQHSYVSPQRVHNISTAVSIAGSYIHSLAILSDGTVRAWGYNGHGELGNEKGTPDYTLTPVPVHEVENATSISAGYGKSLAIGGDGSVWQWGSLSNIHFDYTPVLNDNLSDIVSISSGWTHHLAISGDGIVWAWGWNTERQLGIAGNSPSSEFPVQTLPLSDNSPSSLPSDGNTDIIELDGLPVGWRYLQEGFDYLLNPNEPEDGYENNRENECFCAGHGGLFEPFNTSSTLANRGRNITFHNGFGVSWTHNNCTAWHQANYSTTRAAFRRAGQEITGWSSGPNGTGTVYYVYHPNGVRNTTQRDFTISGNWYAIWNTNPISVTITYNGNRATGGTVAPQTVTVGTATYRANTFTRTGMTFVGWNTRSDGRGDTYQPGQTINLIRNTTLHAMWRGAITYTSEGADGGLAPLSQNFIAGQRTTLTGNTRGMWKAGHDFAGWIRVSPTPLARYTNLNTQRIFQANVTLRPYWKPSRHTGTFTSTLHTSGSVPNNQQFTHGKLFSLRGPGSMRRTGYRFAGWQNVSTNITHTTRVQFTGNVTMRATWVQDMRTLRYSRFNATGGTPPTEQQFQRNLPTTIQGNPGNLVRTGWSFNGWRKGNTSYTGGQSATFNSNVTLHPNWTRNTYTLTFNANGGTGTVPSARTYEFAKSFRLATTNLQREHHTFNGWNTRADGTGRRFSNGGTATLRGETELFAQWKPITYTIRYNRNDATRGTAPKTQRFQFPSADTIRGRNNLEKAGHSFVGWNTRADGYGVAYLPSASVPALNLRLFAIFRPSEPNIVTYNPNGAPSTYANQTYTPNVLFNLRTHVPWAHRTFLGWDTRQTGNLGSRYNSGQNVTFMGGTVRLFARWQVNRYTLTYHGNGVGVTGLPAAVTRNAESSVMVSLGSEMRRDGHIFSGWNTVQNPTESNPGVWYGNEFGQNRGIELTGNVTLFAQWRIETESDKRGTLAVGFEGSAAFIVHVALGGQLVVDRNMNVGIIGSFNPGLGSPSAAIGGTVTATTAKHIKHLEYAKTYTVGGSAALGLPVTIGVDYITGEYTDSEPHYRIHGGMAFVGVSTPWPEGHGTFSLSGVIELNWLPDFARALVSNTVISGLNALPAPAHNVLNEIWEGG
jgi:alpha-tubulin suppressor-like RCC1 family protein